MDTVVPPPEPAVDAAPAPAASRYGWDYSQLGQTWWFAAIVMLVLPHWLLSAGFTPAPPAAGLFRRSLFLGIVFNATFLLVSLVLYTRWRDRLPPVTRPRWYGPAREERRRRGFWVLWVLWFTHAWFYFGLLGPKALAEVLINSPAAYLRPDLSAFGVELLPTEQQGLLHLRLFNPMDFEIAIHEEQRLGTLVIESSSGPYLLGRAQVRFDIVATPELTGERPVPASLAAGEALHFHIPLDGWGVIATQAPPGLPLDILYYPAGSGLFPPYAPLDLYHGNLRSLPRK